MTPNVEPCWGIAAALTRYERPVGVIQSYVVECRCGWVSRHTKDWRRTLDDHCRRGEARRA